MLAAVWKCDVVRVGARQRCRPVREAGGGAKPAVQSIQLLRPLRRSAHLLGRRREPLEPVHDLRGVLLDPRVTFIQEEGVQVHARVVQLEHLHHHVHLYAKLVFRNRDEVPPPCHAPPPHPVLGEAAIPAAQDPPHD
eukprot:7445177-Lingulodinium_polyedra.AAC.1